ncbi:hypothetical protein KAT51_03975 [bacterium]|nr:hypothetical protein [bacterium]
MPKINKLSIKAIIIGLLVDHLGGMLGSVVFGIILGSIWISRGIGLDEMKIKLTQDLSCLISNLITCFVFTFLGSYVAARIAKTREIFHASIIGGVSFVLAVVFIKVNPLPLWHSILFFILIIPVAILGGCIAKNKNLKLKEQFNNSIERTESAS